MAQPSPARGNGLGIVLDVFMVVLAMASLLLLWILLYGNPSTEQSIHLIYLDLVIVGIFWVEYLYRLGRSGKKGAFVRKNWYELPGMVPIFPGMESVGGVRLFRLLRILRILRLFGAMRRINRFERTIDRFTQRSKLGYVLLLLMAIVFASAAGVWLLEPVRFPTYIDALWWAIVTATTVGYGDFYPVTNGGRAIGVILMFVGVALIGTFAATLSSFLVESRFASSRGDKAGLAAELERLQDLHESGALTGAEFAQAKRKLLR